MLFFPSLHIVQDTVIIKCLKHMPCHRVKKGPAKIERMGYGNYGNRIVKPFTLQHWWRRNLTLRCTHLQVIGQFRTSSIARVHGDAHITIRVQVQFGPFERELRLLGSHSTLDAQNLLGDHWQHFQLDTIELVEARPRSARCQTLEEN